MYTLARTSTLHDSETKQVEFVRATGVPSTRLYVYDGAAIDANQWNGWDPASLRTEPSSGTQANKKIWVMREFHNSAAQGLGIPLPKGRVRFYRQDADRQLEFTGENSIDHTPKDETLRIYTGNSFDLVGERTGSTISEKLEDGRYTELTLLPDRWRVQFHPPPGWTTVGVERDGTAWRDEVMELSPQATEGALVKRGGAPPPPVLTDHLPRFEGEENDQRRLPRNIAASASASIWAASMPGSKVRTP
jgi:hypothetical protein